MPTEQQITADQILIYLTSNRSEEADIELDEEAKKLYDAVTGFCAQIAGEQQCHPTMVIVPLMMRMMEHIVTHHSPDMARGLIENALRHPGNIDFADLMVKERVVN